MKYINTLFVFLSFSIQPCFGKEFGPPNNPLDHGDLSSPRATVMGFIKNLDEVVRVIHASENQKVSPQKGAILVKRLLHHLDLSEVPKNIRESQGKETAVYLAEVMARIDLPSFSKIPGPDDILNENDENILDVYRIPKTEIKIVRIKEGDDAGYYRFSKETVANVEEYYELSKHLPYKRDGISNLLRYYMNYTEHTSLGAFVIQLPEWWQGRLSGIARWKWLLIGSSFLGLVLFLTISFRVRKWIDGLLGRDSLAKEFNWIAFGAANLFALQIFKFTCIDEIRLRGDILQFIAFTVDFLTLSYIVFLVIKLLNRIGEIIIRSPRIQPQGIDAQVIRLVCRLLGLIIAVVLFLEGGQSLGIPLTTLIAGAGVGGLTLALAAQDTLKNIFGSMMITLDKPYRVGERIVAKGYDGIVEEIGLRSTRIRLLNGHLVAIPNEIMAACDIENIGRRPHIRQKLNLQLNIEEPIEKVENAVEMVRQLLKDHKGQNPEKPPRVYLDTLTRDWYTIVIYYWFSPPDYWEFMEFNQNFISKMMSEFEKADIKLAVPISKTILEPAHIKELVPEKS